MLVGKIPIYIPPTLNLSLAEKQAVLNTIAEEGHIVEEVPGNGGIQCTADAIRHTASTLDGTYWDCSYMIIVDRPGWKSTDKDGVLVVKMDFEGDIDGLRMPICHTVINIASMSTGNTDWQEYIETRRSKYTWDQETHFAVYVDESIDEDTSDTIGFAFPLIDAGFRGRKMSQGSICCAVEDKQPSDAEEIGRYHGEVAESLRSNKRLGCFIKFENWSMDDPCVRVFRIDEDKGVDSFMVDVEMAGEVLESVAVGPRDWEDEKARHAE